MRTARSSTIASVWSGGYGPGGGIVPGDVVLGMVLGGGYGSGGGGMGLWSQGGMALPPCEQRHTCENITFPQLC